MKKAIALLLVTVMVLGIFTACGGGSGTSGDALEISFWIPKGEDSTYYLSYDENPAVKYMETLEFNGRKVDLTFLVPITGSEQDNFNTLLMTDEYADVMDMTYASSNAAELYRDDYIWDLTPYVEEYMPNYKRIIDEHPELAVNVYTNVDGENKILSLCAITEEVLGNFMGLLYRRDWIAKYGTNPETGAAFTWGYTDPSDFNTWYDDVVFPSGGAEPIYISDWEWMFEIFTVAMADLGIEDGHCFAPYFKGFNEDGGGFFSSFGGCAPMWYLGKDGNVSFGGDTESMRSYLQCMNTWYEKGWMDTSFMENTGDQPYAVNSADIHAGKVGAFIGRRAETGGQMDLGDAYTKDIMVYGARPPMNDIYGDTSTQNQTPYSLYQYSHIRGTSTTITKAVSEEDLPTVLTVLDYMYSEEGAPLMCLGMNEEQFNQTQDETYKKYNITYAYRTEQNEDGSTKFIRNEDLIFDNNLASAMALKRITLGYYYKGFVPALNESYQLCARNAMAEWDYYSNTGYMDSGLLAQFTLEESELYNKTHANLDTFMSTNVPQFITGQLDIDSEEDWGNYCKMLNKYGPQKVSAAYQRVLDSLN